MSKKIILICTVCLNRNYRTYKNQINHQSRLEIKKYCSYCKVHTIHKESR